MQILCVVHMCVCKYTCVSGWVYVWGWACACVCAHEHVWRLDEDLGCLASSRSTSLLGDRGSY